MAAKFVAMIESAPETVVNWEDIYITRIWMKLRCDIWKIAAETLLGKSALHDLAEEIRTPIVGRTLFPIATHSTMDN